MSKRPQITIIEVGPRDGLQNESIYINAADKINFINQLSDAGLKEIEVTSSVSSKSIPQLSDGHEVFTHIVKHQDTHYSALVPNMMGFEKALQAGVKRIALFTAASDAFNQRNIHCSIEESIARFIPVIELAKQSGVFIRGYISCALGCPYEGAITPKAVALVTERLLKLGIDEISLGDTIGVGTPKQTSALIKAILSLMNPSNLALHFHDTYGQAVANIYAALNMGITRFDASTAGLGGCPYAQGASGNVATEDVLYLLHGLGLETGVDIYKIVEAGDQICTLLGKTNHSKVATALLGKKGVTQ